MKYFDEPKTIFIKTFCFESGLWYLGWTLYKELVGEGHTVYFLPKSRYTKRGMIFKRSYPEPENSDEFPKEIILSANESLPLRNMVLNHINKYNPDVIISLETLMQTSQWISLLREGLKLK